VLIVVLAAPYPSAAGMMLVFPTLNGLGFVFSPRDRVLGMVPSMLLMPVINGLLCAAYLLAFLALATRVSSLVSLALILLAAVSAAFVVLVRLRFVRAGVPAAAQLTFANVATLVSLGFAAAALLLGSDHATSVLSAAAAHTSALHDVQEILVRNAPKIALFTLCLAAFLIATRLRCPIPRAESWPACRLRRSAGSSASPPTARSILPRVSRYSGIWRRASGSVLPSRSGSSTRSRAF
jgi:hypothetical protein